MLLSRFKLAIMNFFLFISNCMSPLAIQNSCEKIKTICDMIKRNESDVGDVVLEILAKTVFKCLCFILFLELSNPS